MDGNIGKLGRDMVIEDIKGDWGDLLRIRIPSKLPGLHGVVQKRKGTPLHARTFV